jgi:ferritin-like metal-binding protein YciE
MNNDGAYLVKLLRGETMGINLYEKYLKKLPEGQYKKEVQSFKDEHIRHKTRLENIMNSRNIETSSEIGLQGKMTELMTSVRLVFKNDPKAVLKEIKKGEEMAAKFSSQYLSEFSESIRPDIEKIIKEDKDRISRLNKILKTI